jgi:protochlorophyllide reductase
MLSIWLGDAIGKDNIASKWVASAAEEIIAADEQQQQPRTILLTGCNSGIGFEAARILARKGDTLILACRTKEKADETARKILAETETAKLVPCECDLTSLQSVRKFVDSITTTTNQLDVVCYNAGIALNTDGDIERTVEGFERTVGTNHLGHFYLHHLLQPKIVNNKTGRVVITASSVHDPESPGGKQGKSATLGNLEGFVRDGRNFEMVDGQPYNGDKAYKDSKLCNVLFCRELQRRLGASDTTKNIVVNSFSPGLITSTGFFRYQNPVFSSIFNVVATNVLKVAETPQYGGAALAYMTTVESRGEFWDSPPGTSYKSGNAAFGKEFNVSPVSKEGQVDAKAKKLWELSEKLVGI